jgi:hypothetical protein
MVFNSSLAVLLGLVATVRCPFQSRFMSAHYSPRASNIYYFITILVLLLGAAVHDHVLHFGVTDFTPRLADRA